MEIGTPDTVKSFDTGSVGDGNVFQNTDTAQIFCPAYQGFLAFEPVIADVDTLVILTVTEYDQVPWGRPILLDEQL